MTRRRPSGWRVERSSGTAAGLLAPWPPADDQDQPVVRAARVTGPPAVVLGSTQNRAVVDVAAAASAGIDVVSRTTGGGAVLVAPGAQVWLDLWVPRGDELWDDDIIGSAGWLGDVWVMALEGLGADALYVHHGPAAGSLWSDLVCFAGLGPGEVYVVDGPADDPAGAPTKVTGLAQRRTRAGARFHTSAPLWWDPAPLVSLLHGQGVDGDASLADTAIGLRALLPTGTMGADDADVITTVEDAVIAALP